MYCLGFLYGFKQRDRDFIFYTQRHRHRPCLGELLAQRPQELNVVLGHFGAFRQLFLHIVRHMKHFFKLITMWAVEGEKLQYLGFASDRFIQRDILFTVADLCCRGAKS
ncbi:Uncharacterised protein [Salmonella enterica subsp. enterica serovar Bovismorbificans]|uniref:Uncharacterized protein n=1 Tax=Salmonella enterica subsp. enterica serovar Bovismorbificans TaxID=58097 RepID=A0A655C005_SALET|nr:Uncharacterised protein [Salmonella enterica subsp. enterica serovar Bovismorbificans]